MTKGRSGNAAGASLALLFGCSTLFADAPPDRAGSASKRRSTAEPAAHVVWVALDGVRREDVFGRPDVVPRITELERRGVALGAEGWGDFDASGPNYISLPGYTEMFTSMAAPCQENDCRDSPGFTIVDAVCRSAAPTNRCDAAVFSSWPNIERITAAERGRALVSAGKSGGEGRARIEEVPDLSALDELGRNASSAPGGDEYRPDRWTSALALAYLERERPRFTFVSLGDTDELAHAGDTVGYEGALHRADAFVGSVWDLAERWEARGERTVVIVTADHGRGDDFRSHGRAHPASAHVWLIAAGGGIPTRGRVGLSATRHLRDIAPTVAVLLDLSWPVDDARAGETLDELLPEPDRGDGSDAVALGDTAAGLIAGVTSR